MKHSVSIRILAALTLFVSCLLAKADGFSPDSLSKRYATFSAWCSPEKLYLHVDRSYYTAGEELWFMGWLQNASQAAVHPISKYIYAELLDDKGIASCRVKIKRKGSGFPGCIELPESLESGDYTLRAYTLWNLNNGPEYMFNQKIRILGAKDVKSKVEKSKESDIDISFWPEGGRYFAGCRSVIGFKAMDKAGRSVDVAGWLTGDDGNAVLPVSTRHDGMGVIEFLPKPGISYFIETESGRKFSLPAPATEGATINLRHFQGYIYSSVRGTGGQHCHLLVRDLVEIRHFAEMDLDGKPRSFKAEEDMFRSGINHLMLVDDSGNILSERLFFISGAEEEKTVCTFGADNLKPEAKALINTRMTLSDGNGKPLDGNFSISIVRGSLRKWQQAGGIESYMKLSSELKGNINDPDYYFDPAVSSRERSDNLDLLMMIQGWRYYDLAQIMRTDGKPLELKEVKEYTQSVRGRISRKMSSKIPKKFIFSVFIPKLKVRTILDVDQARTFLIDSLEFEENTDFLINVGTSRLGVSYLPKWDGDKFALPYKYFPAPGSARLLHEEEDEGIPLRNDNGQIDTLQAAVVTAHEETWDDVLTFGRSASSSDLKIYKDRTLIEYLSIKMPSFVYNGENMYNRNRRRSSLFEETLDDEGMGTMSMSEDDEQGAVKLLVDETQQTWWGYDMLRVEEIESISISQEPDPLWGGDGGIVSIRLKTNVSLSTIGRDPSLLYFVPLGYQVPRYFYSPRYDRGDKAPSFDKRNTILWSPDIPVKRGVAEVPFCNTDQMDYPYYVRIEGLTRDGLPFSHHCILDFKEQ